MKKGISRAIERDSILVTGIYLLQDNIVSFNLKVELGWLIDHFVFVSLKCFGKVFVTYTVSTLLLPFFSLFQFYFKILSTFLNIGVKSQLGRKFCSFPLSCPIYFDNYALLLSFVIM